MRTLVAAAVACSILVSLGQAQSSEASMKRNVNIEAQELSSALKEFARERQLYLIFDDRDVVSHRTMGATGEMSQDEVLGRLLKDTGLTYRYLDEKTMMIVPVATGPAIKGKDDTASAVKEAQRSRGFWDRFRMAQADSGASGVNEEEESTKLEEIVVTAQKRQERTLDVPMSITALSGEDVAAAGIDNILDLSFRVPGLSVTEMGPGVQLISIRGINSVRGDSTLIGAYLDEIPVSTFQSTFATTPDLRTVDLDRVEVLKGPQGTLFGEGSAGGVIRFVTKDPDLSEVGGNVSAEFSNTTDGGWSQEITGVANIPIVADRFGIRVAAKYEDLSGWIDQPSIAREDINDSEVKHVRVKALFAPNDRMRLKAMAEIHRNDGGGTNIVNQEVNGEKVFIQAYDPTASSAYYDDYDMFNLTATYDFGFAELLSSTSHAEFENNQREIQVSLERPVPRLEVLPLNAVLDRNFTSQEFRLTSKSSGAFNWTLGANYKDAEQVAYANDGFGAIIFGDTPDRFPLVFSAGTAPTTRSKSWAAFTDASYEVSDRLTIGSGLRYFVDDREIFDPAIPSEGVRSGEFDKLTYRIYTKYALNTNANLYASFGTGFRSGGFNPPDQIALGASPSYDPEETVFYELGAKLALLDGRIRMDGALFYGEYEGMLEDISTTSPVDGSPLQFTSNAQDAEIKGIELSVDWRATDRLTLSLTGDVTDTEIVRIDPAAPKPTYLVGDAINNVPEYGASARGFYSFKWSEAMPGFFQLSINRKGKSFATNRIKFDGLILVDQMVAPEISFINASLGGEWSGWNWSLFGRNLADEDEIIHGSVTGATAQARRRTIGVGFSKSF